MRYAIVKLVLESPEKGQKNSCFFLLEFCGIFVCRCVWSVWSIFFSACFDVGRLLSFFLLLFMLSLYQLFLYITGLAVFRRFVSTCCVWYCMESFSNGKQPPGGLFALCVLFEMAIDAMMDVYYDDYMHMLASCRTHDDDGAAFRYYAWVGCAGGVLETGV